MKNKLYILFFIIIEIYLLSNSKVIVNDFVSRVNICMYTLMPTMFFSILISQILIRLNFEKYIPKCIINFFKNIFNINEKEVIIFLLSLISGYPNNAKMLKNNKNLDKLVLYTNFVNPIFLIGTVGNLYLKNIKIALIIYTSHVLSNIFIGILIRKKQNFIEKKEKKYIDENIYEIYFSSLKNTVLSLVNIFSNILAFSILLTLLKNILKINIVLKSLILGLFEFSSGIYLISNLNINLFLKGIYILIIITFSSFSVHMQQISLNSDIKYKTFFKFKFLNIIIAIILYLFLTFIFL